LVLAGLVAAMSLAFAADGGNAAKPKPQPKPGTLTAVGAGVIEGKLMVGTLEIVVAEGGEAELRVSAKAVVEADKGTKEDFKAQGGDAKRAQVVYKGFTKAVLTGEGMYRISGKGITITAKGAGQATLLGEGTYTLVKLDEAADVKVDGKWFVKPTAAQAEGTKPAKPETVVYGEMPKRGGGDGGRKPAGDPAKPKTGGDKGNKPANGEGAPKTGGEGA
jgi:hypothetical protein